MTTDKTTASKPWFALQRMAHKLMCQGFSHDEAWRRANILLVDEPRKLEINMAENNNTTDDRINRVNEPLRAVGGN